MHRVGGSSNVLGLVGLVTAALACTTGPSVDDRGDALRARFDLRVLGEIPYPPDNPRVTDRIELGRLLFFDPVLSGEKDVSCGTCHHPDFSFADGRQFAAGVSGTGLGPSRALGQSAVSGLPIQQTPRNTQSILNTAFAHDEFGQSSHEAPLFWDGRAIGLEGQAFFPLAGRDEMRGDAFPGNELQAASVAVDSIVARLRKIPVYVTLFQSAFPLEASALGSNPAEEIVTASTLRRAVAAYERELVTRDSPYDRFASGDDEALSPTQMDGLEVFFSQGKCFLCHAPPTFGSFGYFVTGTPPAGIGGDVIPGDDTGREEHTGQLVDRYRFRAPALRNIERTGPYMHAGVFDTLEEVVRFYNDLAQPRHPAVADQDLEVALQNPLGLGDYEIEALTEFLRALTGIESAEDQMLRAVPGQVPSGLPAVVGLSGRLR
jgi:cytochrome c peroxidase